MQSSLFFCFFAPVWLLIWQPVAAQVHQYTPVDIIVELRADSQYRFLSNSSYWYEYQPDTGVSSSQTWPADYVRPADTATYAVYAPVRYAPAERKTGVNYWYFLFFVPVAIFIFVIITLINTELQNTAAHRSYQQAQNQEHKRAAAYQAEQKKRLIVNQEKSFQSFLVYCKKRWEARHDKHRDDDDEYE